MYNLSVPFPGHWYVAMFLSVLVNVCSYTDTVEGVKICETDANGVEHCRTLSEGGLYS